MHIPKWLIATAALLFVVLIAAVAFFIGRETTQPPEAATAVSAPAQEPPVSEASGGPTTSPITASTSGTAAADAPSSTASASLPSTSAPAAAVDTSPAMAEARARVSAYFKQMESLQSGGPIGDQEAFATTVVQAAASGDFSGIDDLVRAAGEAERRAVALQPPGECEEYHRMAVTLLQESRTMITALRDGLKRNDTTALTSLGASAQSMKSRADTLAATEKALRARFGL
jgi:HPt (histidine-containing phosphotransfer) domain-containing protein